MHYFPSAALAGFPLVVLVLLSFVQGEESSGTSIPQLIRDLGSDSFSTREAAQRELSKIGPAAIPALEQVIFSSDLEVRWRARQLVESWRTEDFYTISEDGRLVRVTVGKHTVLSQEILKLGGLFQHPEACVEGLTMSQEGMLYASVVVRFPESDESVLYRIDPHSGTAPQIGSILPAAVTGLDFGPEGRLYGVLASCRHSALVGDTQLIEIDPRTGEAFATATEIAQRGLSGLALDGKGQAIFSNGSCGLFQLDLTPRSRPEPFVCDEHFCTQLGSAQLRGLCYGQGGVLVAISDSCGRSANTLVRLDPKTGLFQCIGELTFRARNLAAARGAKPRSLPAMAERKGS